MRGNAACERIQHLISNVLVKLGVSKEAGGWETLFLDPTDGRLWERTFPHGHMHGGGPPRLATISEDDAIRRYGRDIVMNAPPGTR